MPWLEDELNNVNDSLLANKDKLTGSEYASASQEATEASKSIINGVNQLAHGNSMGGAAALLEGMGQLTRLGAFLGPAGAAAGGILSLVTGIISSILELLNPEKKSLEERIEEIIKDEELRQKMAKLSADEASWMVTGATLLKKMAYTRKIFSEAQDAGAHFVFDSATMFIPNDITPVDMQPLPEEHSEEEKRKMIEEGVLASLEPTVNERVRQRQLEHLRTGLTWEYLKANTNYDAHVKQIYGALDLLDGMKPPYSAEWSALLDQTVGYAYRMWISLHGLVGLVDPNGHGMIETMRAEIAGELKRRLENLSFRAQNICQIYTRWHSGSPDSFDTSFEPMYQRVGVAVEGGFEKVGNTRKVRSFAVSSNGTIFGATEADDSLWTLASGRSGAPWRYAKDRPSCTEVFIGELPDLPSSVVVASVAAFAQQFSVAIFDEAAGVGGEVADEWTANEARWGYRTEWTLPFAVGSVAISPIGDKKFSLYVLGMNDDFSVTLYSMKWDGTTTPVDGFHWTRDEAMKAGGMSLYESLHRRADRPWSCAISLAPLGVQLGNFVRFIDPGNGSISNWDLRDVMTDYSLKTHQGRFYSDGTFVSCSNRGVSLRFWNYDQWKAEWKTDKTNEGEMVQKMPLSNGGLFHSLYGTFRAVAARASAQTA